MKEKVASTKGELYAKELQKLIYNGKILEDGQKLNELNIDEKKFVVVMVSRVCISSDIALRWSHSCTFACYSRRRLSQRPLLPPAVRNHPEQFRQPTPLEPSLAPRRRPSRRARVLPHSQQLRLLELLQPKVGMHLSKLLSHLQSAIPIQSHQSTHRLWRISRPWAIPRRKLFELSKRPSSTLIVQWSTCAPGSQRL